MVSQGKWEVTANPNNYISGEPLVGVAPCQVRISSHYYMQSAKANAESDNKTDQDLHSSKLSKSFIICTKRLIMAKNAQLD